MHRHRHRSAAPKPTPIEPLAATVRAYEQWRQAQPAKPSRGALRDFWRPLDQRHGQRPDYLLWRQIQCPESPPDRPQDPVELALHALRNPERTVHWSAIALVPGVLKGTPPPAAARRDELAKATLTRVGTQSPLAPLTGSEHSCALVGWTARALAGGQDASTAIMLLGDLQKKLEAAHPGWKPGQSIDTGFLRADPWLPVAVTTAIRWLVSAVADLVDAMARDAVAQEDAGNRRLRFHDASAWHLTAWKMLRDIRPSHLPRQALEIELLLNAGATARAAGNHQEAARLTALAVHLLPPQAPESLRDRCRAAGWRLAEAGLATPGVLHVDLDEMPFPGEPPASEKGVQATRLFQDPADVSQQSLARVAAHDPAWQRLSAGGVVLHHPLAALAWIARKAHSYVIRKQHDLLQTAALLAARHHCVTTTGRILAHYPGPPSAVMEYAGAMREAVRRTPVLRDSEIWRNWCACLRLAWGKLEADAIDDPDELFTLHETLLDREVTLLRSLPMDLRLLALRHVHSRRQPSALVEALEANPRLMQSLDHQRPVELWSFAANLRERPEQTRAAWVSLVLRGDEASGRYSLLVHGPRGTRHLRGRLRCKSADKASTVQDFDAAALVPELVDTITALCDEPDWLLLALDPWFMNLPWPALLHQRGLTASVAFIPAWEWAFRVMREPSSSAELPAELLMPEGTSPTSPMPAPDLFPGTCVLLDAPAAADANIRWLPAATPSAAGDRPQTRRSLSIGAYPRVISYGPLVRGTLPIDLTRLSLAQASRWVIAPAAPLTPAQFGQLGETLAASRRPWDERLRILTQKHPDTWLIHGLPWALEPPRLTK